MNIDRLCEAARARGPVCVGLDTDFSYLPRCIAEGPGTPAEKLFAFNRRVVDATADVAGCYKVQIAFYEAMGLAGLTAFADTLRYARGKGAVVISDVKRGDIASTAAQYARGHFTGDFETDFITVNAYMGEDAVSPFYPYLEQGKGLFVLVKTSNKSSRDFQDLICGGRPLYAHMAEKAAGWGARFMGESGFSAIGAVVGLTYPEEFESIRDTLEHTFLLIPGYGAQGGTGRDIAGFFRGGVRGVVNSSRGILTAHKGKTEDEDFDVHIRRAAQSMREDILQWL